MKYYNNCYFIGTMVGRPEKVARFEFDKETEKVTYATLQIGEDKKDCIRLKFCDRQYALSFKLYNDFCVKVNCKYIPQENVFLVNWFNYKQLKINYNVNERKPLIIKKN